MIKKALILGLIVSGLLVCSTVSVTAVEEVDDLNDVIDDNGEVVTNKPNIDIHKLSYSVSGDTVSLKLTVKGEIENKGSINFYRFLLDTELQNKLCPGCNEEEAYTYYLENIIMETPEWVEYAFVLETTEDIYVIYYINKDIMLYAGLYEIFIDNTFNVVDDELSISFNFPDPEEVLTNITIEVADTIFSVLEEVYSYSDTLLIEVPLDANPNDDNDDNDDDSGSSLLFFGIIIAVVIVGIIALIYFIRR